jgi:hypothetical protein
LGSAKPAVIRLLRQTYYVESQERAQALRLDSASIQTCDNHMNDAYTKKETERKKQKKKERARKVRVCNYLIFHEIASFSACESASWTDEAANVTRSKERGVFNSDTRRRLQSHERKVDCN